MNKIVLGLILTFFSFSLGAKTKIVCVYRTDNHGHWVRDSKGVPIKDCKRIIIHKKVKGTKVPQK